MKSLAAALLVTTLQITITTGFTPYGFQSGHFTNPTDSSSTDAESINDDSFAGGMYYDALRNLVYFTGITYGRYFDGDSSSSSSDGGDSPHLANSDCILGVLKLPREGADLKEDTNWLIHSGGGAGGAKLIYARRLGTPQNSEACSAIRMLTQVNDGLVDKSENKLKLALLGHVNPTPLSNADLNGRSLVQDALEEFERDYDSLTANETDSRVLYDKNKGGFFSSLSKSDPITEKGRAYGLVADIDIELKTNDGEYSTANTALLGGYILESSPLVYPVAMAQSHRDPDQIYVVSMHADDELGGSEGVLNPEYSSTIQMESDASLRMRPDLTLGGAGGGGGDLVGGVPKYGNGFYVKVQQLTVTPYETLMNVEPTASEKIKTTMNSGWGFGFKLNDAKDVRPSCVEFIKGKTPDEDLLLLAGTTRKDGKNGYTELDGFVTKLIPPAPSPVPDYTTVTDSSAVETEGKNPTKRIDSTTGRDETVTAICLPPPNRNIGVITHAFIVGSIANSMSDSNPSGKDPSTAYILMMKLDDMSTIWKQRIPSIHPNGIGGDVLGEGCAVSTDGKTVYLAGTIDGGSALNTGSKNNLSNPSDPDSVPVKPVGGISDIFVVSYDVVFGNINWAKQFGTVHEDKLARGGGVAVDNQGNVIVMGSTRGPLQRHRTTKERRNLQGERLASDIFVMNLSGEDGYFINAPYSSSLVEDAANKSASFIATAAAGLSPVGIAGIVITSLFFLCAFVVFICCRGKSKKNSGPAERMWDRSRYEDDYSFDQAGAGYRDRSIGGRRGSGNGTDGLRIVRGGDDWDDGTDRISKSASWMKDKTNISYIKRKSEENSTFLRSLRDEANVTMSKMFKESDATDPRLDDGASIKSLLTHYREVRKGKLVGEESRKQTSAENETIESKRSNFRSNPPPPPPRKDEMSRRVSTGGESDDGLAQFTIV